MEGTSNALLIASNNNVSNFVSVKLSGEHNYPLWKAQMLCLLDSNNMHSIVDSDTKSMSPCDSLVKGWIFGSVSEDVLVVIYKLDTAKQVWEKLQSIYDPTISFKEVQETSIGMEHQMPDAKTDKEDTVHVSSDTVQEGTDSLKVIVDIEVVPTETQTIDEDAQKRKKKIKRKRKLRAATSKGDWSKVESILKKDKDLAREALGSYGSTILHTAVGTGHNHIVQNLFTYLKDEDVLKKRHSDGSTALHIAAIVGNKDAVELLVDKNKKLLRIEDDNSKEPLHKAYENMHLDTIGYLLKAVNDDAKNEQQSSSPGSVHPDDEIGVALLVNTISAKRYGLAKSLVEQFPKFASQNDHVLLALAKTFPTGLDYWEALIYPSLDGTWKALKISASLSTYLFVVPAFTLYEIFTAMKEHDYLYAILLVGLAIPFTVLSVLLSAIAFIGLIILAMCFIFLFVYSLGWKVAKILFSPINEIEKKKKEWDGARDVLQLVCDKIDELHYSGTHHPYYTQPIIEAACQNVYEVVDEILYRSPDSIESTNKNGYDIIQLAIINRSEKIYNLIYDMGERKNVYRTYKDSSQNNILHLAGKLAPSSVLNQRTGAALQLQRELQWLEEVKKFVFPTYITQENIFKQTPDMVFTREHEKLVKEGEKWMKTTAESCSITAALITTIVFAAAITVPGGSNQESGTPLFDKKIAFIIFAITDAISLFASSTALLVFLSILTARFAEKDFLVSLPRRLFIGLFSLVLSTTTMMIAFSATLFLVFSDEKIWMLGPICGLAFIPIASFVVLQFPLMVDLFRSTYIRIFGKQRKNILRRFNPDDIRLRFGNDRGAAAREKKKNEKQNTQASAQKEKDLLKE